MKNIAFCILMFVAVPLFGSTISGTVWDAYDMPVPDVDIMLEVADSLLPPIPYFTTTDDMGYFEFTGIGVGSYSLYPLASMPSEPGEYFIEIRDATDDFFGYDFYLGATTTPDSRITGVVTFYDGTPAPDEQIIGYGTISPTTYMAMTEADGSYVLDVEGDDYLYIFCAPSGFYIAEPYEYSFYIVSGDTMGGYDFVLYPDSVPDYYEIDVWVSDSMDFGISDVQIEIIAESGPSEAGYTDRDGWAYFYPYDPGTYYVRPTLTGHTFTPAVDTIYLDASSSYAYVYFLMDAGTVTPTYTINIFAYDSVYAPIESLLVEWAPSGSASWTPVLTDHFGTAEVNPTSAGDYDLRAFHPNPDAVIIPPETTITLTDSIPTADVTFLVILDTTGIDEKNLPEKFGLQITPNPFNSAVRIEVTGFGLQVTGVEIYDVTGKRVATPCGANAPLSPLSRGTDTNAKHEGQGVYIWQPASNIPSGVYFVKLTAADGKGISKKAVYLK